MKAIILNGFGGTENLVTEDLAVPEVSDNEVLVQVRAIGINPVDIKTRSGLAQAENLKDYKPIILGWDISGIIAKTGRSVRTFRVGDEVFGMVNFPGHGKAYSEFVAAPEKDLAIKPKNIPFEEAAGASLAALTAWQILNEKVRLKSGSKILIHAAAGGVGHYAVQMAKYLGADVTGTASGRNRDFILDLGAARHIDYENQRFEDIIQDQDFVLDTIGGEYFDRSLKVLKSGGTIISIPSGSVQDVSEKARVKGLKGYTFLVRSNGLHMKQIAALLEDRVVKSFISRTYSFEDMESAHRQIESGKTKGKIAVIVI